MNPDSSSLHPPFLQRTAANRRSVAITRRAVTRRHVLSGLAALLSGCGGVEWQRFRSPSWAGYSERIALLPLVLSSTRESSAAGSQAPPWILAGDAGNAMPASQYEQATRAVERLMRKALGDERTLITPEQVNLVMKKKVSRPLPGAKAAGLAAKYTGAHAGLLLSVMDYQTRSAPEPYGEGLTQLGLYDASGDTVFTLSTKLRMSGESGTPPQLGAFAVYAAEQLQSEVSDVMTELG